MACTVLASGLKPKGQAYDAKAVEVFKTMVEGAQCKVDFLRGPSSGNREFSVNLIKDDSDVAQQLRQKGVAEGRGTFSCVVQQRSASDTDLLAALCL